MTDRLTTSAEDYLAVIYALSTENGTARSVDVAQELAVSKASVSNALSVLKRAGLVEHSYYGAITPTKMGIEYAEGMLERYSVIYHFLLDILGTEAQTAMSEACQLNHVISEDTAKRWRAYLANYRVNPKLVEAV